MMPQYLDFENPKWQKGYKLLVNFRNKDLLRKNIGKKICYVDYVERYRGTFMVRYGIIHSVRYSTLYLNDMEKSVDIRDIKEFGIELSGITEL